MWLEHVRKYLFPAANETDAGFRSEIESASRQGLRIIGAIQIAVSILMLAARYLTAPESASLTLRSKQAGLIIALGVINVSASRAHWCGPWLRAIAVLSGMVASGVLIWASFLAAAQSTSPNDFIPGEITLVLLVSVTLTPLRPLHTLMLGLAILVEYVVMAMMAEQSLLEGLGPDTNYVIFIIMLTLLSVGLTAILYEQRWRNYEVLQQTIEAGEALRQAQNRILLTENASSMSHLAAAISHEMNNPLGAMLSGMDTLLLLAQKLVNAKPEEKPKLIELGTELRSSIQQSAERVKELVGKLQRFTDLDETNMQSADVNEILRSVAAMAAGETKNPPTLDLRLDTVLTVMCRPQQLAAVFRSLLTNAVNATNGNGRISIVTHSDGERVEVDIEDNRRGMTTDQIKNIFEPEFRVTGGRVAAGNWSMFNSRQIIREHGGDIRITSREGQGTRVTIVLPALN
jgi:signal transduction histidine kinase